MAMPVTPYGTPRYSASTTILGVAASEFTLDGDLTSATDQPILYLRVCLDASDDVDAAQKLLTGVGCRTVLPGERRQFALSHGATRLSMVGVGSAAEPADYTGGYGMISAAEDDSADALAQMINIDVSSVDEAKTVTIALSATYSSGLNARVMVEVDSHV